MAPVINRLKAFPLFFEVGVCVTAQHREMLDQVLDLFEIKPDFDLDLMSHRQSLTDITIGVLKEVGGVLKDYQPQLVLVHGDTTTTMAATLASFYEKIPVAHVEAGLRTGNLQAPWPEEMNRKVADAISTLYFAPTEQSQENLLKEGVDKKRILVTGNTVIDALLEVRDKIHNNQELSRKLEKQFSFLDKTKKLILITGHRRENFGDGFNRILEALAELALREDVQLVYPVHLNPNVREPALKLLGDTDRIHLLEPQDYLSFVYLMDQSYLIITDSGGVQEEAPSLGKPVLVMRETTERPEAVEAGTVILVGTDKEKIISESTRLLDSAENYKKMAHAHNPYGDGKASERISERLKNETFL